MKWGYTGYEKAYTRKLTKELQAKEKEESLFDDYKCKETEGDSDDAGN